MGLRIASKRLPLWAAYAIAIATVATVIVLHAQMREAMGDDGSLTFTLLGVAVAAYLGGMSFGLMATAATTLYGSWPYLGITTARLPLQARTEMALATHVLCALTITWLCDRLRSSMVRNKDTANMLEASRDRLEAVIDSIADGFVFFDRDWRFRRVNDEARRILGAVSDVELSGRTLWEVYPGKADSDFEKRLKDAAERNEPTTFEDFDEQRNLWFEVREFPSADTITLYLRDITARKNHEFELVAISEQREQAYAKLDALLASAPIGLSYYDRGHRYLRINDFLAEIVGFPASEMVGRHVSEVNPHLAPIIEPILDQVFATAKPVSNFEVTGETPRLPGVTRHWIASFYPVCEGQSVTAVGTVVLEITERKRHEELLQESEDRYRSLVSASSSVVWSADANGEFCTPQYQWEQHTGANWDRHRGLGWLESLHPDDRVRATDEWLAVMKSKVIFETDARLWNANREQYRFVILRAAPVKNSDGSVREWVGTVSDVHEQRLFENALQTSEERYRLLIEATAAIVWATDSTGQFSTPQAQWEAYTGQPYRDHCQFGWLDAIHAKDSELFRQMFSQQSETFECEVRIRDASGQHRYFLVRCAPVTDLVGNVTAWTCMATDTHERKLWEKERERLLASERAARSEAERASRMKDEFISTMSHELRTPLTTILGWTELLQNGNAPADALPEGLAMIERSARLQTQLIEDLLDVSRFATGKIRLDMQFVDLPEIVESATDTMRQAAEKKNITITTEVSYDVNPVRGDPDRLVQIVWNLLSNAVKFTPEGGTIFIGLRQVGDRAEIEVADNGEGIPAKLLPQIFERFQQADTSSTRRHQGLGLGLSIVKQLAELHHGQVSAHSEGKGLGAKFVVSLPTADKPTFGPPPHHEGDAPELDLKRLDGLELLLVDDDEAACDVMTRILASYGVRVRAVHSAAQAMDAFRHYPPKLLVSDIGMPEEDGFHLIQRIRKLPKEEGGEVPAIALTAFARPQDKQHALAAGFQAHISKPVEIPILLEAIVRLH